MTKRCRLIPWCGAAALAALAVGGCGSTTSTTAAQAAGVSTNGSVSVGASTSSDTATAQACSLLGADQASALLGMPATQRGSTADMCTYATSDGSSVILQVIATGGGSATSGLQAAFAQIAGPHAAVTQLSGIGDAAAEVTDALGIKGYAQVAFVKGGNMYSIGGLGVDVSKLEALVRSLATQIP
jgi:predicted flap endonuclease-1-like 5' DNA nuclease